jgi:hypothetical protein
MPVNWIVLHIWEPYWYSMTAAFRPAQLASPGIIPPTEVTQILLVHAHTNITAVHFEQISEHAVVRLKLMIPSNDHVIWKHLHYTSSHSSFLISQISYSRGSYFNRISTKFCILCSFEITRTTGYRIHLLVWYFIFFVFALIVIKNMLMPVKSNSFTHIRVPGGTHWPRHSGPSQPASLMGGFVLRWEDPRGPIVRSQQIVR